MDVKVGDTVEVASVKVDTPPRRGQVTAVLSDEPLELRINWEDGHESVLYPSGGMVKVVGDH